ncbi:hypothetical protein FGIG_11246 [Fasciola gigantica]|uniref:Uncharacterized protein n=1 Tax=Fasciola gigantica TaxID=46835 RepID=A0A504YLN8_FASGI|nr:hypothetical protein FGIG_11246 [Fasciola gigantica]
MVFILSGDKNGRRVLDMAHFRKHLRKRIRHAKRCSLSVLPVHYSTVSGQQIYALNKPPHSSAPSFRVSHKIRRKLTATKSVLSKCSFMTRPSGVSTLSGLDPSEEWRFRQRGSSTVTNPNHGPSKDRMTAKRERKATKTLAIVLGKFPIPPGKCGFKDRKKLVGEIEIPNGCAQLYDQCFVPSLLTSCIVSIIA